MNNSLNGINILVTRAEHQADEFNHLIHQLGGCPINLPLQKIVKSNISINELENLIDETDWILFTSVNSVNYFVQYITYELKVKMNQKKIGAVGEKTKSRLIEEGLQVNFLPSQFTGKTFASELSYIVEKGTKFLFIRGSLASDNVPNILEKNGNLVNLLTVYETIANVTIKDDLIKLLKNEKLDVITFLNPFSVEQFCFLIENIICMEDLKNIKIACIGEVTAQKAKEKGFNNMIVPDKYTIESLLKKIADDI
ncbi:hypothetical protein CN692_16455 [Bacillus sp. AFS002410]|uniref:uroporphyrinogen-III synthase n=1 Tax=Bacillus sp. AFS002410 TaxID=2033481 RepID=UPI000BF15B4B|nr:uroporphyrinogen-III synthase [Bacillus sp. AFS002410]PEJ56601.1 hypothetical protein CN692_16455 [Bacillus sp. AFS002410]